MKEYKEIFNVEEIAPILKKISIFEGISDDKINRLAILLKKGNFQDEEVIFEQGSPPTHIYIIIRGHVRLVEYVNYTPYQLFELGEGNCIGEASIIGIQPHEISAIAKGEVEFLLLSRKALMKLFDSDKDLFCTLILNITKEVSKRLIAADNLLMHYIDRYKHPD